MQRIFYDTETEQIVTEKQLLAVWNNFDSDDKWEYNDRFEDFVKCCQVSEGGTLEEVKTTSRIYSDGKIIVTRSSIYSDIY